MKKGDRILILALSGIGDALMFTPALRLLRDTYPDTQIDVLTMFKGIEDIFSANPDIVEKLSHTNVFSRERNSNNFLATDISLSFFELTFCSNQYSNLMMANPSLR